MGVSVGKKEKSKVLKEENPTSTLFSDSELSDDGPIALDFSFVEVV